MTSAWRSVLAIGVASLLFPGGLESHAQNQFTAIDLGTLGGDSSAALAVNDSGQIAGTSRTATGAWHAFYWTQNGGIVDLDTLPGGSESFAAAINGSGQVVGQSDTTIAPDTTAFHGFLWTTTDGMTDVGGGTAVGVNDAGEVVTNGLSSDGEPIAFLWTPAAGSVRIGSYSAYVWDVSDRGQIAGQYMDFGSHWHAAFWTIDNLTDRGMTDIGPPGMQSRAVAVNDHGQVLIQTWQP